MIKDFYSGKSLFLTGCTGFLGKVILEKVLYSLDNCSKVYVLIRSKKGTSLDERFKKEILDTPCFDRLRAIHGPNFIEFIREKVKPISGDLLKDGIDFSPEDLELLTSTVNVIIHSAASVDFDQRLDKAAEINIYGAMKVLDLARACRNLDNYVHISTAYVSCDKGPGLIHEKIYPLGDDPENILRHIASIPVEQIEKATPAIIRPYPNTYTFTKRLGEHMLEKFKGTVPVCICRPTIISASWKDPFPGWSDSVAAAGAFFLAAGLGLL
jgi:fatty acyl-CoA reductase